MVQKESPIPSSSDKSHVIRTSAQWDTSSDQYHVIPRGVLCIELTSDGKTKMKVGEGNKFYAQLPYINDIEDLSNYYTKEEVDLIISNLEFMSIKSTEEYESRNQLPKTGNRLGDVRFVKNPNNQYDDPLLYVWNNTKWVFSGGSIIDIDLSEYCKKSEILPRLQQLEAVSHTHINKNILDETSAVYTTEKDEKLASLKNYDVFVPETATEDGVDGLVPAPSISETNKFLRGDGTWDEIDGDKYDAGEGITILSGETIVTNNEARILPKAMFLENYAVYGNDEGGVGDQDQLSGKYIVTIRTSTEGSLASYETSVVLDNPIEADDYIIYDEQAFVHHRSEIHWSTDGITVMAYLDSDGDVHQWTGYWGYDKNAVSDYIEIEPGKIYETEKSRYEYAYAQATGDSYRCFHAYYDENKQCTRTVPTSMTSMVTFNPTDGEKYIRLAANCRNLVIYNVTQPKLWLREKTTEHVSMDPVRLFPNEINIITVETTVPPSKLYVKSAIDESTVIDPDDPSLKFTGIIYNDGVLDITQEDPNNSNVLTVHFRDNVSKDITIDTGGGGTEYAAGDGISFEQGQPTIVQDLYTDYSSDWQNWTYYSDSSPDGISWYQTVSKTANESRKYFPLISRQIIIEAYDVNDRALWGHLYFYNESKVHYGNSEAKKTGSEDNVITVPDSVAYIGFAVERLPDSDTTYDGGRRESFSVSDLKSVVITWIGDGDDKTYINNEGVLEVSPKQSSPGVLTVTDRNGDTDIDLFNNLGQITLNCNMNPE